MGPASAGGRYTARCACSPLAVEPRATPGGAAPYFFLAAAAFALVACWEVTSACFFLFALSVVVCFCVAFLCVDFGDLSPMILFGYMFYTVWWHTYLPASIGRLIDSLA